MLVFRSWQLATGVLYNTTLNDYDKFKTIWICVEKGNICQSYLIDRNGFGIRILSTYRNLEIVFACTMWTIQCATDTPRHKKTYWYWIQREDFVFWPCASQLNKSMLPRSKYSYALTLIDAFVDLAMDLLVFVEMRTDSIVGIVLNTYCIWHEKTICIWHDWLTLNQWSLRRSTKINACANGFDFIVSLSTESAKRAPNIYIIRNTNIVCWKT